jgi:homoserine kinase
MLNDGRSVRIRVPGTSANLGPGFDVLGLALALYNTFTVTPADEISIDVRGHGAALPRDDTNLFYRAFSFLFRLANSDAPVPSLHIKMELDIPPGSGLGSSATAVVGGLAAANALLGNRFSKEELLPFAVQLEHGGHADNVAPALLGGLVVNTYEPVTDRYISLPVPFPEDLRAVLLIPQFEMDTVKGRALMPAEYTKSDVVFTTSRIALFMSALQTGRYDLLRTAMQDKMHQPYRAQVFPIMPALIAAALDAGAYGACLSGGGSSILAFAGPDTAQGVGDALLRAANAAEAGGNIRILDADREGAAVTNL